VPVNKNKTKLEIKRVFIRGVLLMLVLTGCASYSASADVANTAVAQESTKVVIQNTPLPVFTATPEMEPSLTSLPTAAACTDTTGKIIEVDVPNKVLSHPLKVKMYLPPCYEKHPKTPYPYVIMIHGMLYTDDQWDRLGADEAADELISSGEVPPFVILMPLEEQSTANPFEDGFGDAITDGLIPWVEQNYPVCTDRSCRAIGGLSRGAGWAIHIGLSKPEYFSAIGAHSLPIFIGDLASTPRWLSVIKQPDLPRVYIDIGIGDGGMAQATQFENILTAYNVPHEWYINNGEHTEGYWSSHVKEYMRWYASGWKTPEPPVVLN
jgi:enterochelin esterase-like enzyme